MTVFQARGVLIGKFLHAHILTLFFPQDYFVLIPESYYEATVLTKIVDKPCVVGDKTLCRDFAYPSLVGRPTADVTGLSTSVTGYIDNVEVRLLYMCYISSAYIERLVDLSGKRKPICIADQQKK